MAKNKFDSQPKVGDKILVSMHGGKIVVAVTANVILGEGMHSFPAISREVLSMSGIKVQTFVPNHKGELVPCQSDVLTPENLGLGSGVLMPINGVVETVMPGGAKVVCVVRNGVPTFLDPVL